MEVFDNDLALHGHKGGRRGQCGSGAVNTLLEALEDISRGATHIEYCGDPREHCELEVAYLMARARKAVDSFPSRYYD